MVGIGGGGGGFVAGRGNLAPVPRLDTVDSVLLSGSSGDRDDCGEMGPFCSGATIGLLLTVLLASSTEYFAGANSSPIPV